MLKKLKTKMKKYDKYYRAKMKYIKYYEKMPIDEYSILLESQHGSEINGNIFYIIRELATNELYSNYKIYLSVRAGKYNRIKYIIEKNNIPNINLVILSTKEYFKILASAKYLINDNTFLPFFVKKEGQIYLNTWHGTPLKTLGKQIKEEAYNIGNAQKNFVFADYLLYPNEYTRDHMIEDYMLNNISNAQILLTGYPRNTAFFNEERKQEIKEEMNLMDKKIYIYMPTWRGVVGKVDNRQSTYLQYFFYEIEKRLQDDEILYVNLHPIAVKNINFKQFKKIKQFPLKYETYEFLNIADCLITDYSSVFFDFSITKKKIILFTYDKEEYLEHRGTYLDIDTLPYPQVFDVESLMREINTPINYDDTEFLKTFTKYDASDVTEKLCKKVILGEDSKIITEKIKNNGKENILIYVGNLAKNGITTSIKNLLSSIDTNKYNYYITFESSKVKRYKEELFDFPEGVNYIATTGKANASLRDKILIRLFDKRRIKAKKFIKLEKNIYKNEIKRNYGNIKFSTVIQFNGYEAKKILLFSMFDANRIIYVHNDMDFEIKTRGNQRRDVLEYAYSNFDKVALVTQDLKEPTSLFTKKNDKFYIANNFIDYKTVLEKASEEILLDSDTAINIEFESLLDILNDKISRKFINIGRFSPEKGHDRLIDAFNRVWQEDNNTYLIIIGGHGKEYNNILKKIKNLDCKDNIVIIKSLHNPFAILKKCDYFVFSSYYEGFGLVIAEADILNKPVISTDITGPRCFLKKYNGSLVENSEEGLYKGMKQLLNGEIKPMNVNYEEYNKEAIKQYKKLLEK